MFGILAGLLIADKRIGSDGLGDNPLGNRKRSELLKRLVSVRVPSRCKSPAFLSARILR